MAATVQIDEYNGTTAGTKTANITNSNMGSIDAANLDPVANPITPGNNSFEKYQKIEVTAMGGSSAIKNFQVWRTGALGGAAVHKFASTVTAATPVATASSVATGTMPTAAPGTANVGIGGSLSGQLTATGLSDFIVHQIQTNAADVAGSTSTMNYQYDEIA